MPSKEEIENKEKLLREISKEQYGDEWFIEKAILSYKRQQEKTYTFFRNDKEEKLLRKYNFCQRPDSSNMSLRRFTKNGEIEGWVSESLAEEFELVQVDLNEFIWKFIQPIIKENLLLDNKTEQLERKQQKLIEKLEEESKQLDEETKAIAIKLNEARDFIIADEYEQAENDEYILILEEKYEKANIKRIRTNEILRIVKGEIDE